MSMPCIESLYEDCLDTSLISKIMIGSRVLLTCSSDAALKIEKINRCAGPQGSSTEDKWMIKAYSCARQLDAIYSPRHKSY